MHDSDTQTTLAIRRTDERPRAGRSLRGSARSKRGAHRWAHLLELVELGPKFVHAGLSLVPQLSCFR